MDPAPSEFTQESIGSGTFPDVAAITVRQAGSQDLDTVRSILVEAGQWTARFGVPTWIGDELSPERLAADIKAEMMFLADVGPEAAATIKFQLSDLEFWPDAPAGESAYIHRLAVRRRFAGMGASTALMAWAVERTQALGLPRLRLDCDADRPRLRAVYERFGFRYHSDRQVGPYYVARYELKV